MSAQERVCDLRAVCRGELPYCVVVAEIGINHNCDTDLARSLIKEAAKAGVDAVKFQAFGASDLVSRADRVARDLFESLELSADQTCELVQVASEHGVAFFASVFSEFWIDRMVELGVPVLKIASSDLTHFALIRAAARTGLPLILSTGYSDLNEVKTAVAVAEKAGARDILLLHCCSSYPAPPEDLNLRAIQTLRDSTGLVVGFSDHSQGIEASLAAVALGAVLIERHFTLDHDLPGPDHAASLDPQEMASLVSRVRELEVMLGDGIKRPQPSELENRVYGRRSLVAERAIQEGEVITADMLRAKRPGLGIPVADIGLVLGRRAARDLAVDEIIRDKDLVA